MAKAADAPVHSMTAFARETGECAAGALALEIRSVNHRYLDCSFKLPEALRALELEWREITARELTRGKVECQLRWQGVPGAQDELRLNRPLLAQLAHARAEVQQAFGDLAAPDPMAVLQYPGVLESGADHEDELKAFATTLYRRALTSLQETRAREGQKLAGFIRDRLEQVLAEVEKTREEMPTLIAHQRERLLQRLGDVSEELEPGRLEQEMVLLAQKTDVEEELDRLQAHVEEVGRVLSRGGPCGRRLDFLMQELNREANTLSSKSIASSTTKNAVELKVLIEQMREQIQNLE